MSDVLKRLLCLALALVVVFSFAGCRKSPVLEQTIYTQDAETDPDNQQTDNDEEHTEEDTTLPPRTTQQTASRENSQTRVSAKPKTNPNNRNNNSNTNTNSRSSNQSNSATGGGGGTPNSTSNTNKGQADGQGAKDDPNANIPAVDDRSDYDPDKTPSNLATVAAPGQIALYVEMLGGQNRLLATSPSFKYDSWAPGIFEDLNSDRVMGLWENEGTDPMSDAQFRQLLQANPEGVFYIFDAQEAPLQSFNENQLRELVANKIYLIPLHPFNRTENIIENVRIIGQVLGDRTKDISGAKNATQMAEEYVDWVETVNRFDHPFSGPNKLNLDAKGSFSQNPEVMDRYSDDGIYTVLIEGWDDGVNTMNGEGAAYVNAGWSQRYSPVSHYLSLGGIANTAVLTTDVGNRYLAVTPPANLLLASSVHDSRQQRNGDMKGWSNTITGGFAKIGSDSFKTVIAANKAAADRINASYNSGGAWSVGQLYEYQGASVTNPYAINVNGTYYSTNIVNDYHVVVNPYGVGSWTEGSPESLLEAYWAEALVANQADPDSAFDAIQSIVRTFYNTFYSHDLTPDELQSIKAGI
ncbi:MAG: hypothetical protein IJ051_08485 [Clostridia bacterium]|nr:hypothetical protein [Clostridia bacterium]